MTREEIINGLKMSIDLMLFDPTTGEVKEPHQLNDMDRTSYEAFKGAMEILAQPQRTRGYERVVYCGECAHMMSDGRCREFADDNIRPSASDYCSAGEKRADM